MSTEEDLLRAVQQAEQVERDRQELAGWLQQRIPSGAEREAWSLLVRAEFACALNVDDLVARLGAAGSEEQERS